MKIAVAPTVLVMELLFFHKVPPPKVVAAVALVCLGIGIATVTDSKLIKNLIGLFVGLAATVVTALYQVRHLHSSCHKHPSLCSSPFQRSSYMSSVCLEHFNNQDTAARRVCLS
jgi:hypothetical protein